MADDRWLSLGGTAAGILKGSDADRQKQEEEEKESKLVAGISLDLKQGSEGIEGRGKEAEDIKNAKREGLVEREKEDHTPINSVTPPLNTKHLWEASEIPLIQIITESPNPPSSRHIVSASEVPASAVPPGEEKSVFSLLAEALQQPEHHLRSSQGLLWEEGNSIIQAEKDEIPSKTQTEALRVSKVEPITKHLKANFTEESSGNKNVGQSDLGKNKARSSPLKEQVFESTVKQKEASPPQLQQRKPQNRGSKSKKAAGSKEKKSDSRTPKVPKRKEDIPPTHFPYFLDDYCPPECACYGR